MTGTDIPAAVIAAYQGTWYRVELASGGFTLRNGVRSLELAQLYHRCRQTSALFITAWNPYSAPQTPAVNAAVNLRLRAQLAALTRHIFAGQGIDPTGQWTAEDSFLALGIDEPTSRALGTSFQQNAVLWADASALPHLILLR